jgi:hypothetical protein
MAKMKRDEKVGCGVIIVVLIAVVWIVGLHRMSADRAQIKPFEPHASEYANTSGFQNLPPGAARYITGKIICVSTGAQYYNVKHSLEAISGPAVDYVSTLLPEDLRAIRPENVGTVALLDWRFQQSVTYTNGSIGGYHILTVRFVDRRARIVIGEVSYRGPDPPDRIINNNYHIDRDVYGLQNQLLKYIAGLPKK